MRCRADSRRRCQCMDCEVELPRINFWCTLAASKVSSRNLQFLFFTEQTLSCDTLRKSAEKLVQNGKGRFRASTLVDTLFAARIGSEPIAGCRWEPGEWFAAVLEEPAHRPVSFYHGAPNKGVEVIQYLEATSKQPVQGATSWGFSLLLHRLKLKGALMCKLVDESEPLKTPVVIDEHQYTTRGSLIYGRTLDPKRPYTYPARETELRRFLWSRTQYIYDLSAEVRGELYPPTEPL